jgi:hypothetical protein
MELLQLRVLPKPLHALDLPLPIQLFLGAAFAYCTGTIMLTVTAVTRDSVTAAIATAVNAVFTLLTLAIVGFIVIVVDVIGYDMII